MTKDTCHSFDTCPLRSSSLLIVHHEQQVIVTASDAAFDMLGFHADELINQRLSILSLSTHHGHQVVKIRHVITKQWIQLEVCVHGDPFSTASGLDYCLLRVISAESQHKQQHQHQHQQQKKQYMATVTLLGLNAYGSIVHAYPATDHFPRSSSRDMVGRPIMSFIHTDDVRPLCRLLRKSTTHPQLPSSTMGDYTMDIRWLKPTTQATMDAVPEFEWMQITIVNPTVYSHVPALNGRPICLLRPSNASSTSSPFAALGSLMAALENGRIYCMEFINHLLACLIQLLHDFAAASQQPLASSHHLSPIPSISPQHIKVMDGTSIRLIPLSSAFSFSHYSSSNDNLFYLLSSTFLSYAMPTSFLPDRSMLDFLKPILPQTKSPSSPL